MSCTWVDHVVCNNLFVPCISDVGHVSFGTNLSDHSQSVSLLPLSPLLFLAVVMSPVLFHFD